MLSTYAPLHAASYGVDTEYDNCLSFFVSFPFSATRLFILATLEHGNNATPFSTASYARTRMKAWTDNEHFQVYCGGNPHLSGNDMP